LPAPTRAIFRVRGLVTPARVNWPSISPWVGSIRRKAVETKLALGNLSAFRNWPEISLAKPGTLLVMEAVSMVAFSEDLERSAGSQTRVAWAVSKRKTLLE